MDVLHDDKRGCIRGRVPYTSVEAAGDKDQDWRKRSDMYKWTHSENVDLASNDFSICCKPDRSIFQIIYNFLSNPFFQINEYSCPPDSTPVSSAEVILPILGVI